MQLTDYALGQADSKETLSYLLEYGSKELGSISGGSAHKHLIFQHKSGWRYPDEYADENEAWTAVRSGFVELLDLAAAGEWTSIDDIEGLLGARAVRCKIAFVFHPDELLPIYSLSHLEYWCDIFQVDAADYSVVGRNRKLFETLRAMPQFSGWSPLEMMHFLYEWAPPNQRQTALKVTPGKQASLWPDALQHNRIRVGWDELGDLSIYDSTAELALRLTSLYDVNKSTATKTAKALELFRDLKPGDRIIANRGTKAVIGIGTVTSGYLYDVDLSDYRHVIGVQWTDTDERAVSFGSAWMPTIVRVTNAQLRDITSSADTAAESTPLPSVPDLHLTAQRLLDRSGQVILYGPPGTGKTFSARRHAIWLLAGGANAVDAALAFGSESDARALEQDFVVPERRPAWLIVANPSRWSWSTLFELGEDTYSHGLIKRHYEDVQVGDRVFGYEATPTKRVVATATVTRGLHDTDDGKKIRIAAGQSIPGGPTWDELKAHPVLSKTEPLLSNMQGTLFRLEPEQADILAELMRLPVVTVAARLTRVTFHPTYAYEDFIEGYKPTEGGAGGLELAMRDGLFKQICDAASRDADRPYVLLIDEINRANVPKVFGELITLIEHDKRGLPVTLPQSGRSFVVPPNVKIIATMNTADRSIHVLDAALRRRFGFLELMPDVTVLTGSTVAGLPLDDLLAELNGLVREKLGREKQIGHALLMDGDKPISSPEAFALAFRYELLPLLQEYTYGDYRDLADLVGDEIIDRDAQAVNTAVVTDPENLARALGNHLGLTA